MSHLYLIKSKKYKRSNYLNTITIIEDRKKITKLRTGCSKLNGHKYLNKNSDDKCPFCPNEVENLEHFLIKCQKYESTRNSFFQKLQAIDEHFMKFNNKKKNSDYFRT